MSKMRLSLEDLTVESFDATPVDALRRGTVRGHQAETATCFNTLCGTCYTVEYFCGKSEDGSCDGSLCNGSCGPGMCPETYNATCPHDCRTQGVYC
jgi:hypothetical protein